MKWTTCVLPLLSGICLASVVPTTAAQALIQGTYAISAVKNGANYGCMIVPDSGHANGMTIYNWSASDWLCGADAPLEQAQWFVYAVQTAAARVHIIKNLATGRCLVRDAGGANTLSMYLWPDNTDKTYCGQASAQALVNDGRAAWNFNSLQYTLNNAGFVRFTGPLYLGQPGYPRLGFTPTPPTAPNRVVGTTSPTFSSDAGAWTFRFDTWPQD